MPDMRREKMSRYTEDKKRMDEIADKIARREPLKEWAALYWMAVAIGHILERMEKTRREKE